MLGAGWERPQNRFYRSFEGAGSAKGAYQLVENPRCEINLASMLAAHELQSARRMAAETVVLLAQDTTALSYNTLHQSEGLGSIGEEHSRGLFLHSLQAFRLDGIPLGTAWAEVWARPPETDTAKRNEQSVDEKESGRWIRALQAASQRAGQMPQTQVLVCGDRESDMYELYDQLQGAPGNLHVLVRGQHDRCLSDGTRLVGRWYALRWGIEVWHKVLKVVCGVERRQMKSAQALERALALDMIVASRVLLLSRLGKEHPDLPAELFYSPEELEVLEVKKHTR